MPRIELTPMTQPEYEEWAVSSVSDYAKEKKRAQLLTDEEAQRVALESFARLLPLGLQTENQFIFSIFEASFTTRIGSLWFGVLGSISDRKAFLYDIFLTPEFQNRGYGKEAMALLEIEVRKRGLKSIGLHVFGHNTRALTLYLNLGYGVTDVNLTKVLSE